MLERYAAHRRLPVVEQAGEVKVGAAGDGAYTVHGDGVRLRAPAVVVAAGVLNRARRPPWSDQVSPRVSQLDTAGYRSPG